MPRQMKDSGVDWIDVIPAGWHIERLKGLFSFGKGLPITKDNLIETGMPVISYGQIHSKLTSGVEVQDHLLRFVSDDYCVSNPQSLVKKGDFIFADTSEDLEGCGNCVYVDIEMPLFAGYHTIIFSSKASCENKYFAYLFKTDAWRSQIRSKVSGVKLFSISRKILGDATVIVPNKCVQKSIVTYLDKQCAHIDTVLEQTRASIEEYKKLKQALITKAVTKGVCGERTEKTSEHEWIGSAPVEWQIIKIKWLLEERKERSESGEEEPLSMSQKYGLIPTKKMDVIPNMASSFVGAKLTYVGDLVFNKLKAHLGVFSVSQYDGLVSPDYAVYYSTGRANVKFLEYLFKTPQYISEFKKKSSGVGAGLTRLYTGDLYSIYCALPPLDEQEEIVRYIDEKCRYMDQLISKKEKFLVELENYKKSMIYEYVTGKKEVPQS